MAVGVFQYDSLPSITDSTRDVLPEPSLTSGSARAVTGVYSTSQPSSTSAATSKKRRLSKLKTGRALPRSMSTPHLRGHIMSASDEDKKRNKLGYQRISIACAHCRRRKIRCLVAEGDPKCQNCHRLKKECVFYPVEQQSAIENKSQSSKAGGGTEASSTVSSSPPEIGVGRQFDDRRDASGFHTLPSNAPSGFSGVPSEPGSTLSNQGSFPPPEYRYASQPEPPWGHPNEFAPNASPAQSDQIHQLNHNFMRYNNPVSPGDVAPFYPEGMHPPTDPHVLPQYQYSSQRPDSYWQPHQPPQPPLRSMSYDHSASMPSNDPYAVHYQSGPVHHYPHVRHAPLSIAMQNPGMMTETAGPHSAPIREYHHAFADHPHPYMLPPEVQGMHGASPRPEYTSWYSSAPQFAPVTEEGSEQFAHDPSRYANQDERPG